MRAASFSKTSDFISSPSSFLHKVSHLYLKRDSLSTKSLFFVRENFNSSPKKPRHFFPKTGHDHLVETTKSLSSFVLAFYPIKRFCNYLLRKEIVFNTMEKTDLKEERVLKKIFVLCCLSLYFYLSCHPVNPGRDPLMNSRYNPGQRDFIGKFVHNLMLSKNRACAAYFRCVVRGH